MVETKKRKSRREQRQIARVREDEIRHKSSQPEEVVQQKKDRRVSRELNATMVHGNALDAREKRISELKWLLDTEDDPSSKKIIIGKIKEIIMVEPPVSIAVEESDDDKCKTNIPSSAKIVTASSTNSSKILHVTPVTELWGDDANSDCFSEVQDEILCAANTTSGNDYSFDEDMSDDITDQRDLIAAEETRERIEKGNSTKDQCSVKVTSESDDDIDEVDFFATKPIKKVVKKRNSIKKFK